MYHHRPPTLIDISGSLPFHVMSIYITTAYLVWAIVVKNVFYVFYFSIKTCF